MIPGSGPVDLESIAAALSALGTSGGRPVKAGTGFRRGFRGRVVVLREVLEGRGGPARL